VALCGKTKWQSLGHQLETHDLDAHPVDLLKISWRQLPTRPKLADPFDMSQLSEDAAVRRLGDRLGFGLSGNALIEAQQRRLTATLKPYLSLPLTATPEPNRHHTAAAVDSTPAQCGRR